MRGSRFGARSMAPPSTRCGIPRRRCWPNSASRKPFATKTWAIETSRPRSGTRICARCTRFRRMSGWRRRSPSPTWSPRRASARAGSLLGLRPAARTNSMLGPGQTASTNMRDRNPPSINDVRARSVGPVSLLGLLLGLIQGHLKKSKQRQRKIENSEIRRIPLSPEDRVS